jgi:hypothetical protein
MQQPVVCIFCQTPAGRNCVLGKAAATQCMLTWLAVPFPALCRLPMRNSSPTTGETKRQPAKFVTTEKYKWEMGNHYITCHLK